VSSVLQLDLTSEPSFFANFCRRLNINDMTFTALMFQNKLLTTNHIDALMEKFSCAD